MSRTWLFTLLYALFAVFAVFTPKIVKSEEQNANENLPDNVRITATSSTVSCRTTDQVQHLIDSYYLGIDVIATVNEINAAGDAAACIMGVLVYTIDEVVEGTDFEFQGDTFVIARVTIVGSGSMETDDVDLFAEPEVRYQVMPENAVLDYQAMRQNYGVILDLMNDLKSDGFTEPPIEFDWPQGWNGNPFEELQNEL